MAHEKTILCMLCHVMDRIPESPGLPLCECRADGHGPCHVSVCLRCLPAVLKLQAADTRPNGTRRASA
jgi:hypothetical protein